VISNFEQAIYNTHLRVSRSIRNKPFKLKKDFTSIEPETELYLKKLSAFFKSHTDIKMDDFFKSSYIIHKDEPYFDLKHFTSLKAIKAYTVYQKQNESLDPDNDDQIEMTKSSIKFIHNFCKEQEIHFSKYLEHKTNNINTFLLHLKERKINIYSVIAFKDFDKIFKTFDYEVLRFMFNEEFINNISTFKIKYLNSDRCKSLITKSLIFFNIFS